MALVDQQLGGDMALLGELRLLERLPLVLEIGAGILPVGIEEQLIEAMVEIVMMGDVAPRPPALVALMHPAKDKARRRERARQSEVRAVADRIARRERHKVVKIAARHLQAAVHVEFAKRQLGIDHQRPLGGRVGEANGDRRPRPVAECALVPVAGLDFQRAAANEFVEKNRQNPVHFTLLGDARPAAENTRPPIERESLNRATQKIQYCRILAIFPPLPLTPNIDKGGVGAYLTGRCRRGAETDVKPSVFALLLSLLASPDG